MAVPKSKSSSKKKSSKIKKHSPESALTLLKQAADTLEKNANLNPIQAFEDAGLKSPIVLYGEQHIRIKRTVSWIRDKFFSATSASSSAYFGQDLSSAKSVSNIVESLKAPSLFAQSELITIYEADKVKVSAAQAIADALTPASSTALVILTAGKLNQKAALLSRLPDKHTLVSFEDLSPAVLRKWIEKEARSGGCQGLENDAAQLLIRCYGSDVDALSREISKLSLLTKPTDRISKKLVQELSLKSPEVASFELMKQIANGNASRATRLANDLVAQGFHPLQLSSFISRCFRTIIAQSGDGSSLADENLGALPSELGNAWFSRNLGPMGRNFSPKQLIDSIEILRKLDFQLKDSGLPATQHLSMAVQKMSLRN